MKILKLKKSKYQKILNSILELKLKKAKNYFYYFAQINEITIHLYKNKTLLLQGDQIQLNLFLKKYNLINEIDKKKLNISKSTVTKNYWGGDESGVGDFFGPIVLTIVFINENLIQKYQNKKIKDSKTINEIVIKKIANEILKIKNVVQTKIISNFELQEKIAEKKNIKEIICEGYLHLINQSLNDFKIKNNIKEEKIYIIDGFISQETLKNYQKKWNWKTNAKIELFTKAEEKFLGVGLAAIVSRFIFLKEIEKINKILNIKILLGANNNVKKQVQQLIKQYGLKKMKKFIKINYNYLIKN